ncbi:MAG: SpoIIE family protein phosphatase [Actinomycetota bacterium]|nr:SpoIIE family protein phosphatase [Actinomycetota bacterium]
MTQSSPGDQRAVTSAFEGAPVMLALCEGDALAVTACNAMFRSAFQATLGADARQLLASAARPSLADRLEQVVSTGETYAASGQRFWIHDANGHEVEAYLDVVAEPLRHPDGMVRGASLMAVNSTQSVRARRAKDARTAELHGQWLAAHDLLTTMQDAMLPEGLPVPPGANLAARYLLADSSAGGDWFDAVALPDGRVILVVGDVVGHGVGAAVVMGELRAIFDERVRADGDIVAALSLLDHRARRSAGARAATVCAVALDPLNGTLDYCTAGHPPPLTLRPGRGASYLPGTGGRPLGSGEPFPLGRHRLDPGDLLVLYSNGLVERPGRTPARSSQQLGGLAGEVHERESAVPDGETLVQRVCAGLVEEATREGYLDDVTVLAAQRVEPVAPLTLSMPARPDGPGRVHRQLAEWLRPLNVSVIDETLLQQSVGELVGNVAEHAYPADLPSEHTTVDLDAKHRGGGVVEITVTDHGRWRDPQPVSPRGRGLAMVQGFCDEFVLQRGATGTRARVRHRPHRSAEMFTGSGLTSLEATLDVERRDGELALRGPIDRRSADRLRHELTTLTRGGTAPLLLDLTGVTALASAGVQVLHERLDSSPGLRLLAPVGSPAQHVLDLVRLPYRTTRGEDAPS